jgi:hypothetical protein
MRSSATWTRNAAKSYSEKTNHTENLEMKNE